MEGFEKTVYKFIKLYIFSIIYKNLNIKYLKGFVYIQGCCFKGQNILI